MQGTIIIIYHSTSPCLSHMFYQQCFCAYIQMIAQNTEMHLPHSHHCEHYPVFGVDESSYLRNMDLQLFRGCKFIYIFIYGWKHSLIGREAFPIRAIPIYTLINDKFRQIKSKNPIGNLQKICLHCGCEKQPPTQRTKSTLIK